MLASFLKSGWLFSTDTLLKFSVGRNLLHDGRADLSKNINFCLVKFEGNYSIRGSFNFVIILFKAFFLYRTVFKKSL